MYRDYLQIRVRSDPYGTHVHGRFGDKVLKSRIGSFSHSTHEVGDEYEKQLIKLAAWHLCSLLAEEIGGEKHLWWLSKAVHDYFVPHRMVIIHNENTKDETHTIVP